MEHTWTKPFYGVQHLETGHMGRPQYTVEDYGEFTEAVHFTCDGGFTRNPSKTFNGENHLEDAKAWLEERYERDLT